jgi:hypothetical protein
MPPRVRPPNREYLEFRAPYRRQAVYKAAQVMNTSADLINAAIEELIHNRYELPAFWTLNRTAQRVRAVVQRWLAQQVFSRLTAAQTQQLDRLLILIVESSNGRRSSKGSRNYRSALRGKTWRISWTI